MKRARDILRVIGEEQPLNLFQRVANWVARRTGIEEAYPRPRQKSREQLLRIIAKAQEDIRAIGLTASTYHRFIGGMEAGYYDSSLELLKRTLFEWAHLKNKEEGIQSLQDPIANLMRRYRKEGLLGSYVEQIEKLMRGHKVENFGWRGSARYLEREIQQEAPF